MSTPVLAYNLTVSYFNEHSRASAGGALSGIKGLHIAPISPVAVAHINTFFISARIDSAVPKTPYEYISAPPFLNSEDLRSKK